MDPPPLKHTHIHPISRGLRTSISF
eukprot:UN12259